MGQREEARETTRRRLLDATVSALAEVGYRGTTTLEVQRRSGTSRGNLLHHFGSRSELMLAAVDHVVTERLAEAAERSRRPPPAAKRLAWAVRAVWSTFDGCAVEPDAALPTRERPFRRGSPSACSAPTPDLTPEESSWTPPPPSGPPSSSTPRRSRSDPRSPAPA